MSKDGNSINKVFISCVLLLAIPSIIIISDVISRIVFNVTIDYFNLILIFSALVIILGGICVLILNYKDRKLNQ